MSENALTADALLDERALSKLRWRCRRGLLENDLFIARFFAHFEPRLTQRHAQGLLALMDLADNDLLDLLLRRSEPHGALDTPEVREVLQMLRHTQTEPAPVTSSR
ncbi:succinate dehydrogenase assembly factor 2 [Extensimonas vulgaris]|jgi:antitoxin CptB|uniref:FAD assembly factor SdhE n=1 Tax=Extensimonas vulgaris TaxID=1031594 RepID=A0A369AIH6_9BURK|nr:succinate dehydrogenase assembly factor 2 [Extensimonas vulgaris]RCX08971.1 antitoxin CptB [Extensimonas vulgaris]TWI37207.1 antitoxin CptB [Extensimonas vulgaris]TXD14305.1 succinate dehydrogenase assembly factor 2 [Extensimonas vulgaris]